MVSTTQRSTGHLGQSDSVPNCKWIWGKFVTMRARSILLLRLADDRADTSITMIVIFACLVGEFLQESRGREESVVIVKALSVALQMQRSARMDSYMDALSLSFNLF